MAKDVGVSQKRRVKFERKVRAHDVLMLIIGAALAFAGIAIFDGQSSLIIALLTISALAIAATLAIDALRASAENEIGDVSAEFRADLHEAYGALRCDLEEHHEGLISRLERHLSNVHATVQFIPDEKWRPGVYSRPGYEIAEEAVRRATHRISVIGDYSPPKEQGAEIDSNPPANRLSYFKAIEQMLEERLESNDHDIKVLEYRRYIQRPVNLYSKIARNRSAAGGVTLKASDMEGDLQAFEHCARVLAIAARADKRDHDTRISVDLRLIPFLPNCPAVLMVDDQHVQVTIPTRINLPARNYSSQGLLGLLVMDDKAKGDGVCWAFIGLFRRLRAFSLPVVRVEDSKVQTIIEVKPVVSFAANPLVGNSIDESDGWDGAY